MVKVATLEDVAAYPELNLVEGQEFEVPESPLNLENAQTEGEPNGDEADPPPGGNNPGTKPPIP